MRERFRATAPTEPRLLEPPAPVVLALLGRHLHARSSAHRAQRFLAASAPVERPPARTAQTRTTCSAIRIAGRGSTRRGSGSSSTPPCGRRGLRSAPASTIFYTPASRTWRQRARRPWRSWRRRVIDRCGPRSSTSTSRARCSATRPAPSSRGSSDKESRPGHERLPRANSAAVAVVESTRRLSHRQPNPKTRRGYKVRVQTRPHPHHCETRPRASASSGRRRPSPRASPASRRGRSRTPPGFPLPGRARSSRRRSRSA